MPAVYIDVVVVVAATRISAAVRNGFHAWVGLRLQCKPSWSLVTDLSTHTISFFDQTAREHVSWNLSGTCHIQEITRVCVLYTESKTPCRRSVLVAV